MKRDLKESKSKKQAAREGRREKFEVKTECIRRLGRVHGGGGDTAKELKQGYKNVRGEGGGHRAGEI